MKAVENGGTCIGIRCRDGVVLALEKLVTSKLLKKDANKRIATVDRNIGVVCLIRILFQCCQQLTTIAGLYWSSPRWSPLCQPCP